MTRRIAFTAAALLLAAGPGLEAQAAVHYGRHCYAGLHELFGTKPIYCRLARARPLGAGCGCAPDNGVGPRAIGRVVR